MMDSFFFFVSLDDDLWIDIVCFRSNAFAHPMDVLFDMRCVDGRRTCSHKSIEKEVGVRQDSFLGSPQGPLRYCGIDFQGCMWTSISSSPSPMAGSSIGFGMSHFSFDIRNYACSRAKIGTNQSFSTVRIFLKWTKKLTGWDDDLNEPSCSTWSTLGTGSFQYGQAARRQRPMGRH